MPSEHSITARHTVWGDYRRKVVDPAENGIPAPKPCLHCNSDSSILEICPGQCVVMCNNGNCGVRTPVIYVHEDTWKGVWAEKRLRSFRTAVKIWNRGWTRDQKNPGGEGPPGKEAEGMQGHT